MARIKLNLNRLSVNDKIAKGRQIVTAMTNNASFPNPTPPLRRNCGFGRSRKSLCHGPVSKIRSHDTRSRSRERGSEGQSGFDSGCKLRRKRSGKKRFAHYKCGHGNQIVSIRSVSSRRTSGSQRNGRRTRWRDHLVVEACRERS